MLNPGKLRHKITVQKPKKERDKFGEEKEEYEDFFKTWASIDPLVGKEFFAAESVASEVTHKVRIRYHSGVLPEMIVKFGTRTLYIQSVINYKELNTELQLMCRELI